MTTHLIASLLFGLIAVAGSVAAWGQAFPTRAVRFVTVGGPGSGTDLVARAVGDVMTRALGQPVVVEARTGAGGTIAANHVLGAEHDGHTVLVASPAHVASGMLYRNLAYDAVRDFAGITPLAEQPTIMVVPSQRGWRTVKDVVAAARAKPGAFNFGSAGNGSGTHMSAVRFALAAGIEAQHVAYKSTPEVLTEIVAGRIDWHFAPLASALAFVRDGRLIATALSAPARSPELPDLPTMTEQGLADADYRFWIGLLVPARTPRAHVQRLHDEAVRAVETAEARERLRRMGATPLTMRPADFDRFLRAESEIAGTLIRAANIRVE